MKKFFSFLILFLISYSPSLVSAEGEKEIIINSTPRDDGFLIEINLQNLPRTIFAIAFDLGFDGQNIELVSTKLNLENLPEEYLFLSKKNEKSLHFALSSKKGHLLQTKENYPLLEFQIKTKTDTLNLVLSNLYLFETISDFEIYKNIKDIKISQNTLEDIKKLPLAGEANQLFSELKRFVLINVLFIFPFLFTFIFYLKKRKEGVPRSGTPSLK